MLPVEPEEPDTPAAPLHSSLLRFGVFALDRHAGELRRGGRRVRLQPQPLRVLSILASRAGEVVTRDELRAAVWGEGTYVEIDAALNTAIRHIRRALGDGAPASRFIETLPRIGYRFVAPVTSDDGDGRQSGNIATVATLAIRAADDPSSELEPPTTATPLTQARPWLLAAAVALALLLATAGWRLLPAGAPVHPRLAVLPVLVEPGHADWEALGERLLEQSLVDLARRAGDRGVVLGRAATAGLRHQRYSVDLAETTGADYLLDTSLRELPDDRVRLHVKVVRGSDSWILWGGDYELPRPLLAAMVPTLTSALARRTMAVASGAEEKQPPPTLPATARAALAEGDRALSAGRWIEGIAAYRRAVSAAPRDAGTRASLAIAQTYAGLAGAVVPWTDAYRAAEAQAELALRLDPAEGRAHAALGGTRLWLHRDLAGAEAELRQATRLQPDVALGYQWLAIALAADGRPAAAVAAARESLAIEPLHPFLHAMQARAELFAGDLAAAERAARLARALDERHQAGRQWLALSLLLRDRLDEAAEAMELPPAGEPASTAPGSARWRRHLAAIEAGAGSESMVNAIRVNPMWGARVSALLGDEEGAWRWLQRAEAGHYDDLVSLRTDPCFTAMRGTPRWQELLARLFPAPR